MFANPDYEPVQVECGWSFSSVLMKNGDVLVWWPASGTLAEAVRAEDESLDTQGIGKAEAVDDVIPCHTWKASADPVLLPSLPPLPDISNVGGDFKEHPPRLIEIGGMVNHIVGLTNYGHVLKLSGVDQEQGDRSGGWQYVGPLHRVCRNGSDVEGYSSPNSVRYLVFVKSRNSLALRGLTRQHHQSQ